MMESISTPLTSRQCEEKNPNVLIPETLRCFRPRGHREPHRGQGGWWWYSDGRRMCNAERSSSIIEFSPSQTRCILEADHSNDHMTASGILFSGAIHGSHTAPVDGGPEVVKCGDLAPRYTDDPGMFLGRCGLPKGHTDHHRNQNARWTNFDLPVQVGEFDTHMNRSVPGRLITEPVTPGPGAIPLEFYPWYRMVVLFPGSTPTGRWHIGAPRKVWRSSRYNCFDLSNAAVTIEMATSARCREAAWEFVKLNPHFTGVGKVRLPDIGASTTLSEFDGEFGLVFGKDL